MYELTSFDQQLLFMRIHASTYQRESHLTCKLGVIMFGCQHGGAPMGCATVLKVGGQFCERSELKNF